MSERPAKRRPGASVSRPRAPLKPGLPARAAATAVIDAVLAGRPLEAALDPSEGDNGLGALPDRDRGLARAIVGAALRRFGQIDDALGRMLARPLPAKARMAKAILVVGAAQLMFLDVPDHAAVSLAVDLAHADRQATHHANLINGVLRRLAREKEFILAEQDSTRLNTPAWMMARWSAAYGEAAALQIAAAHLQEAALDLGVKQDAAGWAQRLGGVVLPTGAVRLTPHGPVERLEGYADGGWWVQDAAAALPPRFFGDVAGKHIADLCAAPGGKTAALAAAGALVTAVDQSGARLARLNENLARLRLSAEVVEADLRTWEPDRVFDGVLLDAPCSATGTLRRHPDIALSKTPADIEALAALQSELLVRAAAWVAPGGLLVYCTCSLEPEEGERQIESFLASHPEFARVPLTAAEAGGIEAAITPAGDLRTLPFQIAAEGETRGGWDGFFGARLRRL